MTRAMKFYLHLHPEKQLWLDYDAEECFAGILRNHYDLYEAVRRGDQREILAEAMGVINYASFLIDLLSPMELEGVQDYQRVLDEIYGEES